MDVEDSGPSHLSGIISRLRNHLFLSDLAIDELERLLDELRSEGWSGFITADDALKAIIEKENPCNCSACSCK